MTEAQIKRPNTCPDFALSELGDVETGRKYRPMKDKLGQSTESMAEPVTIWDYIDEIRIG